MNCFPHIYSVEGHLNRLVKKHYFSKVVEHYRFLLHVYLYENRLLNPIPLGVIPSKNRILYLLEIYYFSQ